MSKVAVVAVGGNSLIQDRHHTSYQDQYVALQATAAQVVELIEQGWTVVLTHGNGPQVGFSLERSEIARDHVPPAPTDVAVADTQGTIGYHFQQALQNQFARRGLLRQAVTVVTRVLVDAEDPAFDNPSKPIGGFLDEKVARERYGQAVVEDSGRGWRRVVASPQPRRILELEAVKALVSAGFTVVAVGGGGIPVIDTPDGHRGVEAVIDKDLASSLLARQLKAELLLISTAVESVSVGFGTSHQQALGRIELAQARAYLAEGQFKPGSMRPKMEAAIAFVEETGNEAVVTNPENLVRAVNGQAGTRVVKGESSALRE
jgi:carbamate kinase